MGPAPSPHGLPQVAEGEDPEPPAQVEEAVEHLGAGLRVRQGPVLGARGGSEELGHRRQADVGQVGTDDPAGQLGRADRRARGPVVAEAVGLVAEEAVVEGGVVGHEHAAAGELEEAGESGLDGRGVAHRQVVDPRDVRDVPGDRDSRVHQGLERPDALAPARLHGPDLGDPGGAGHAPGGLEVHEDEGHLRQRGPEVLEGCLNRLHASSRRTRRARAERQCNRTDVRGQAHVGGP